MELQNTPFTVQLGRGASIQLANAVINTGNSEATIQFGSLEFPVATAMATAVPIHGMTVQGHSARPYSVETYARRAYSVQQPRAVRTATAKAVQQNRTSVFERLSHPEVSTVKKTDIKQKTLPILSSVVTLPTEPFVPGRHDYEASSSGGRLSRRQRRKLNAKLRAQQPLPVHPSTLPALEPEANVPTQNKFTNLKWVKRNSSTGELKQSFWEQQQQAPAPQKKKYETLSARVHRVLKVARENGLMKKKYQKPFINKTARIPQRELPAARVTQEKLKSTPRGEHWSMKPELRIQESADKRSRWKGKEIWRPRLPERRLLEKNIRIGVTSGIASQRSASKKNHQQWVPKEKVHITNTYNSRHLGESSKESYCQPTSTYQKEINVDRTPPIEELPVPHAEPEIYWKRRSEIRVQGNDDEEDTMEVEVVYMVGHSDEPHQTRGYKRRNEAGPASSKTTTSQEDQVQYEQLEEEEEVPSGDDQNDDQEEEVLAETLAQAQRRLKFQMKEKDKEISELNSKMTEMMAQMTAMMQLMQKNIITNPAPVITSSPILPINEEDKSKGKMMSGKDEWQTAISKKTMKMIKQLEGVPGIKWKSSTEPVLELKGNPNSGASTSRSLTWRRSKTKRFYKSFSKKSNSSNKHSKLKEKRTVLQKIINNLEDYRQPMRRPITLADFMSELQIDPSEIEDDEQEDEELLHVETCRVISVTSIVCQRDFIKDHDRGQIAISPTKMINKMTSESCLMVLQTDDSSEEELCFPSDDESDQQIVSQMERAKLNEDSKHTIKTSSDEAESNEVDQVQLRSGKNTRDARHYVSGMRKHEDMDEAVDDSHPKYPEEDAAIDLGIDPRHKKLMKPHQIEGFRFLVKNLMVEKPGGCILAHAPGSGKTFMLISFMQSFITQKPDKRPLVVLPKGILSTWKKEFQQWQLEDIPLFDFYSSKADHRSQQLDILKSWEQSRGILFLGYKQFTNIVSSTSTEKIDALCREKLLMVPGLLILDEGHTPRNNNTAIVHSLSRIKTPRKVVLSGTLFQNHVKEVFNILKLVRPKFMKEESSRNVIKRILSSVEILASRRPTKSCKESAFCDLVHETLQNDDNCLRKNSVIKDLREMTHSVLHYYKGDFLDELPGMVDFTVLLKLTSKQKSIASRLHKLDIFKGNSVGSAVYMHPNLKEVAESVDGDKSESLSNDKVDGLIGSLNVRDGVKTKFFLGVLSLSESAGEKLLVFSQYILPLKFLERLVIQRKGWRLGKEVFMISGDSNPEDREWSMEQFNNSTDAKVLFGSIKACGEGISLVGASRILILDVHLNPSVTRQAIGRAFRPGQRKKVYTYRLVAADSPEEEHHNTSFKKEVISKLWFECNEYSGQQEIDLHEVELTDSDDIFLESPALIEDIKCLYKR
ncbi:hypothetical protein M5K25_001349 [Dendrobium thyrsiflorum]|uniref:Uncharacterized protein n=1 Tax=Dendrobium thyrsiflorum TaxID=117978 RepID=A0ABD0VYQ7_DENTH